MCSHYQPIKNSERLKVHFGTEVSLESLKPDVWPGYSGVFVRAHEFSDVGDEAVPQCEALIGSFGLIPNWASDQKIARHTYNARTETVAEKPSFRDAWRAARHCIIPAETIFEPDWRSGKAIPTGITRVDGQPMGIAGLWALWKSPIGDLVHSFTMLTINAGSHSLMNQFHKPTDEKRMVVILPEEDYLPWLKATREDSAQFLQQYPANKLRAQPA